MTPTITFTDKEAEDFFTKMGFEVRTVEVEETEKQYHNQEMALKRRTKAITCPHTRQPIELGVAFTSIMSKQFKTLLLGIDKGTVYLTLKELPKLNIQNNEQN